MNRGIYGLGNQAANGIAASPLWTPGQSVGLYARFTPWLGNQNTDNAVVINFSPRPYVVISSDPLPNGNNGLNQFTGLAIQIPTPNSAFVVAPGVTDTNQASLSPGVATGAARGQGAVDVQTYRTASFQVASNQFSTAVGQLNTASGGQSVAVGFNNTASGLQAVALGYTNTAGNTNATALGGLNTSSGSSSVAVGFSNTASGTNSTAVGNTNTASTVNGTAIGAFASSIFPYAIALSGNRFTTTGDSELIFARQSFQTTTATATQLFGDNTAATSRLTIAASTSYAYKLQLVARQTGGAAGTAGDTAVWNIEGGIYRAAAGNAILLGATQTSYFFVAAAAAWTATVSADIVNQALVVTVAGEANKNINWVAFWQLVRSA